MRVAATALRTSFLATLAGLLCWAVVPVVVGWSSTLVTTGSMLPGIRPGDIVVVSPMEPAEIRPGMVLLVDNPAQPGNLLLHRLVAIGEDGRYVTKGDTNAQPDTTPVPPGHVVGVGRLRVPYLGLPVLWARHGQLIPLVVTVGVLAVAVWWRPGPRSAGGGPGPRSRRGRAQRRRGMPSSSAHCQTGRMAASGSR